MARVLSFSHSADTEGSFLFPPSCCFTGSCQLVVVGLLKPFSLSWVGAGLCSVPLVECCSVFSPSSIISIPYSSASSLVFRVPHWHRNRDLKAVCFQLLLTPCSLWGAWSMCSKTPMGAAGAAVGVPQATLSEGRWALLPQSLPPGKGYYPCQSRGLCWACCSWSKPSLSAVPGMA